MALQRTTEGKSGEHSYTREGAEPFALRTLNANFQIQPARVQTETLDRTLRLLEAEQRSAEFAARFGNGRRPGSALAQYAAKGLYGIRERDLFS